MFIGDRVDKIEAELKERKPHKGIKVRINIINVREDQDNLLFEYEYIVDYVEVGAIKIRGVVFAQEEKEEKEKILEGWKKNKKIEDSYMERLLNVINYAATSHAIIIARVLNYPPHFIPPRLSLRRKKESS